MLEPRRLRGRRRLRRGPLVLDHRRLHVQQLDVLRRRSHAHEPHRLLHPQAVPGRLRSRLPGHRIDHAAELDLHPQRGRRPDLVTRRGREPVAAQLRLRQPQPRLHDGAESLGGPGHQAQSHDLHVEQRDPRQRRHATTVLHGAGVPGRGLASDVHLSRRRQHRAAVPRRIRLSRRPLRTDLLHRPLPQLRHRESGLRLSRARTTTSARPGLTCQTIGGGLSGCHGQRVRLHRVDGRAAASSSIGAARPRASTSATTSSTATRATASRSS